MVDIGPDNPSEFQSFFELKWLEDVPTYKVTKSAEDLDAVKKRLERAIINGEGPTKIEDLVVQAEEILRQAHHLLTTIKGGEVEPSQFQKLRGRVLVLSAMTRQQPQFKLTERKLGTLERFFSFISSETDSQEVKEAKEKLTLQVDRVQKVLKKERKLIEAMMPRLLDPLAEKEELIKPLKSALRILQKAKRELKVTAKELQQVSKASEELKEVAIKELQLEELKTLINHLLKLSTGQDS